MRVGVILAARSPAPFLDEALRSVLSQAPAPDRVVVVDHASPSPLAVPPGVELVRLDDAGGGPARPRSRGLETLDTELIALIDADDVWEPGKLAAQLAAIGNAGVCFGRAQVIDASGQSTGEHLPELAPGLHEAAAMAKLLYARNWIPAASALIRRDALVASGGFEAGPELPAGSDWDLWLRIAGAGFDFVCEPQARIRYRRHPGGLTSSVSRLAEAGLAIHERHRQLVDDQTARRARARDLVALAQGRIRERRYDEARAALTEAAKLEPPTTRERALKAAAAMPVLRSALGRRRPYPRSKV